MHRWCSQRESQQFQLLRLILQACPRAVPLAKLSLGVPFGYQLCSDEPQMRHRLLRGPDSQPNLGQTWHCMKKRQNWLSIWQPGHKGGLGLKSPRGELRAASPWVLTRSISLFLSLSDYPALFCFILLSFFKIRFLSCLSACLCLFLHCFLFPRMDLLALSSLLMAFLTLLFWLIFYLVLQLLYFSIHAVFFPQKQSFLRRPCSPEIP